MEKGAVINYCASCVKRAPRLIGLGGAARYNPHSCVGTGARIWIFRGAQECFKNELQQWKSRGLKSWQC